MKTEIWEKKESKNDRLLTFEVYGVMQKNDASFWAFEKRKM